MLGAFLVHFCSLNVVFLVRFPSSSASRLALSSDIENTRSPSMATMTVGSIIARQASTPAADTAIVAEDALSILNNVLLGEPNYTISAAPLKTFTATNQGVTLVNTLVASYALGVWDSSEAILCSVAGTPSEKTFFSLARAKFRKPGVASFIILKADKKALNMFELSINSLKFAIQYRQAPISITSEILPGLLVGSDSTIDTLATRKCKAYADAAYLVKHVSNLAVFRATYFAIKSWALRQGVYSSRFEYLREAQLLVLVAHACHRTAPPYTVDSAIEEFFALYCTANFDTRVIFDDDLHEQAKADSRPTVDFAKSTTRETFGVIKSRIVAYARPLEEPELPLYLTTFASKYKSYVKIDLSYWGPSSSSKGGRFVDAVDMALANWVSCK